MKKFIQQIMSAVGKYSIWDYIWFKTGLISFGIILGAYFSTFFLDYIFVVWMLFSATTIFIIYRTLIKIK